MKSVKKMGSMLMSKSCTAEFKDSGVEDISVTPRSQAEKGDRGENVDRGKRVSTSSQQAQAQEQAQAKPIRPSPSITIETCQTYDDQTYLCKLGVLGGWQELPPAKGGNGNGHPVAAWNFSADIPEAAAGTSLQFEVRQVEPPPPPSWARHSPGQAMHYPEPHVGTLALGELAAGETFRTPVFVSNAPGHSNMERWMKAPRLKMMVTLRGIRPVEEPAISLLDMSLKGLPVKGAAYGDDLVPVDKSTISFSKTHLLRCGLEIQFGVPERGPLHLIEFPTQRFCHPLSSQRKQLLPRDVATGDKVSFTVTTVPDGEHAQKQAQREMKMKGQLQLGALSPCPGSRFQRDVQLGDGGCLTVMLHGVQPADVTEQELALEADQMRQERDLRQWNAAGRPASVTLTAHEDRPLAKYLVSIVDRPDTRSELCVHYHTQKVLGLSESFPVDATRAKGTLEFVGREVHYHRQECRRSLEPLRGTLQLNGLASAPDESYERKVLLKWPNGGVRCNELNEIDPLIVLLRGVRPSDMSKEEARAAQLADQVKAREDLEKQIGSEVQELLGDMFKDMLKADRVDIISTPFYPNPGAEKAKAFKAEHEQKPKRIVFNPNDDLQDIAKRKHWTPAVQERKWVEAWTTVLLIVQQTGGTCYVVKKGGKSGVLEGNAQQGEVNIMLIGGCIPEYIPY